MTFPAFLQHLGFAFALALLSAAAVRAMIAWPILDHPNSRSAHARPTPRGGGVGVVLAFVAGMLALYQGAEFARIADRQFLGVIGAAVAIAAVALLDDARDLSARLRFFAQFAAALVALGSGLVLTRLALPWSGVVDLGWAGPALTLFWILGCTNAVNFMDGLDGLVGGTVLVACAALAAVAASQEAWFIYAAALFLLAGFAGFLPFNLHPARIFMGDVGSQFAGFVLAVLGVAAARLDAAQVSFLILPLLLFGLLFDAGFTLLRRARWASAWARPTARTSTRWRTGRGWARGRWRRRIGASRRSTPGWRRCSCTWRPGRSRWWWCRRCWCNSFGCCSWRGGCGGRGSVGGRRGAADGRRGVSGPGRKRPVVGAGH
jgi:UDP-GlcNAc:undecaprenyl-phosphate GlcNAc-1-phosphate transferase